MSNEYSLFENEQYLIEAIVLGDENAFKFIYDKYYTVLCLYSNKYINDLSLAEDMVQECIFTLWEQREKLSHVSKIKSYLFKSVHNKCINYINHLKVQGKYASEAAYQLKMIELEYTDSLIMQELNEKITKAINGLSEKCRICFQMKRIDGYSQKEIAEKLSITEKAVEANISRALKQLRIELNDSVTNIGGLIVLLSLNMLFCMQGLLGLNCCI